MATIEGAANHTINTTKLRDGREYNGPNMDLTPDKMKVIINALSSAYHSAQHAFVNALGSGDEELLRRAGIGLQGVQDVLGAITDAASNDGSFIDTADVPTRGIAFGGPELFIIITALVTYKAKSEAALAGVKAGEFEVVDTNDEDSLTEGQISLESYNRVRDLSEQAPGIAAQLAEYVRAVDKEFVDGQFNLFLSKVSAQRDALKAQPVVGHKNLSGYDAMLETATVLFDVPVETLDAMLEGYGSKKN